MENGKLKAILKAIGSSLIWGLGQIFNRQFIKAAIFLGIFSLLIFIEFSTGSYSAEFDLFEDKIPGNEIEE